MINFSCVNTPNFSVLPHEVMGSIVQRLDRISAYDFLLTCSAVQAARRYIWIQEARQFGYQGEHEKSYDYLVRYYAALRECCWLYYFPKNWLVKHRVKFRQGKPTKTCIDIYRTAVSMLNPSPLQLYNFLTEPRLYIIPNVCLILSQFPSSSVKAAMHPNTLCTAVRAKNTAALGILLASNANPNPHPMALSPLHQAAKLGYTIAIELLLNAGANINAVWMEVIEHTHTSSTVHGNTTHTTYTYEYHTPLELAIHYKRIPVVRALLNAKADPTKTGSPDSIQPFYHACQQGQAHIIKIFLECVPNNIDRGLMFTARAALMYCNRHNFCFYQSIALLLNAGANANQVDGQGKSQVYHFVKNGDINMVRLFSQYHADLELRTHKGKSPLLCAVKGRIYHGRRIDMVKCLVECGADVNALGPKGNKTILEYAHKKRNKQIYHYLSSALPH